MGSKTRWQRKHCTSFATCEELDLCLCKPAYKWTLLLEIHLIPMNLWSSVTKPQSHLQRSSPVKLKWLVCWSWNHLFVQVDITTSKSLIFRYCRAFFFLHIRHSSLFAHSSEKATCSLLGFNPLKKMQASFNQVQFCLCARLARKYASLLPKFVKKIERESSYFVVLSFFLSFTSTNLEWSAHQTTALLSEICLFWDRAVCTLRLTSYSSKHIGVSFRYAILCILMEIIWNY